MSKPKNLPWLDRLNVHIPGYPGYQQQAERRGADRAIRDAIANRLTKAETNVTNAIQQCIERQAEREVGVLQVFQHELQRLTARVQRAGSPEEFFTAAEFDSARADALHALDHALLDRSDVLVELTHHQSLGHDWLARLKGELETFERKLDARALLFQHLP